MLALKRDSKVFELPARYARLNQVFRFKKREPVDNLEEEMGSVIKEIFIEREEKGMRVH